jgi:hypothetical protein
MGTLGPGRPDSQAGPSRRYDTNFNRLRDKPPKRGGSCKGVILLGTSHGRTLVKLLEAAEAATRQRRRRKLYYLHPIGDYATVDALREMAFVTEGVLRSPYRQGQVGRHATGHLDLRRVELHGAARSENVRCAYCGKYRFPRQRIRGPVPYQAAMASDARYVAVLAPVQALISVFLRLPSDQWKPTAPRCMTARPRPVPTDWDRKTGARGIGWSCGAEPVTAEELTWGALRRSGAETPLTLADFGRNMAAGFSRSRNRRVPSQI